MDDRYPHYRPQTAADAQESKVVGDDGEVITIGSGDPKLAGIIASMLNAYGRRKDFDHRVSQGRGAGLTIRSDSDTQLVGDAHGQGPGRILAAADQADEVSAEHRQVIDFLMGLLTSPTPSPGLPRFSPFDGRFEEHSREIPAGAEPWGREVHDALRALLVHHVVNAEAYQRFARDMRERAREEFGYLEQPVGPEAEILL